MHKSLSLLSQFVTSQARSARFQGPRLTALGASALLLAGALGGCSNGSGESGAPLFAKTYGSPGFDSIGDAAETPDGGFVIVGSLGGREWGTRVNEEDLWVTKLDSLGDPEWSRSIAHGIPSAYASPVVLVTPRAVAPSEDGGFFVASIIGEQLGSNPQGLVENVSVLRINTAGVDVWDTSFDVAPPPGEMYLIPSVGGRDKPHGVAATSDGGAVVVGRTAATLQASGGALQAAFGWAAKVDANGTLEWTRYFTDDVREQSNLSSDGMFVVATRAGAVYCAETTYGHNLFNRTIDQRTRILRIDENGTVEWLEDVDDFFARELNTVNAPLPLGDDGLIMVGDEIGSGTQVELQLGVVLDANGSTILRRDFPFDRIDTGAGALLSGPGEVAYQFIGSPLGGSSTLNDTLEVLRVDRDGEPVPGTGDTLADVRFARASRLDRTASPQRFELCGSRRGMFVVDPEQEAARLSGTREALTGATFDTTQNLGFLVPNRTNSDLPNEFMGWFPGSTDLWSYTEQAGQGGTFELTKRESSGIEIWSREFSYGGAQRAEEALDVQVLVDPASPANWRIVIYARADIDVTSGPANESRVPWLVVLDNQANVISETAFSNARLGEGLQSWSPIGYNQPRDLFKDSGAMVAAQDGNLFLRLEVEGSPRIAKVRPNGEVVWCSAPVELGISTDGGGLTALADGGVLAASGKALARFDANGGLVWRRNTSFDQVFGLCQGEDGNLCVFGVRYSNLFSMEDTQLLFDLLDVSGERLSSCEWSVPAVHYSDVGAGMVAAKGGGYVAQLVRILPRGLTASLDQWTEVLEIVKVNASLEPQWRSVYGGLRQEGGNSIARTGDGGLLVSGRTHSVTESMEAWFLRLDSCGRIGSACGAEFEHVSEGFDFSLNVLPGGSFYDELTIPAPFDVPGNLSTQTTSAIATIVTDLGITRQCSGSSRDPITPPLGTFYPLQIVIGGGQGLVEEVVPIPGSPTISCTTSCTYYFEPGTVVSLRGLPDAGFTTPTWSGGECGSAPSDECSVTMDGPRTLTVTFPSMGGGYSESFDLEVIITGSGEGSVFVSPPGITCQQGCVLEDLAAPGDQIFLTALPAPGSTFGGFSGVDSADGSMGEVTFGMANRTVTVTFN